VNANGHAIDVAAIEEAGAVLKDRVRVTPVVRSAVLDELTGAQVFLKLENLQRGASFKIRGAYRALLSARAAGARSVVTYSSGNHGIAVSLAARELGLGSTVVCAEDTTAEKLGRIRAQSARVLTVAAGSEVRAATAGELAGGDTVLIPPYDAPDVMAGQGTLALEMHDQVGDLDVIVVQVSGGGLAAGVGSALRSRSPHTRIIGVEPEAGDDTRRSLCIGRRVRIEVPLTIADGLRAQTPGLLTFPVLESVLDDIAVVSDDDIRAAMKVLADKCQVFAEPSGAAGLAAVLSGAVPVGGQRVGVIVTGGNITMERFIAMLGAADEGPSVDAERAGEPGCLTDRGDHRC